MNRRPQVVHTPETLKARCVEEGDCLIWTGYFANGVPMVSHDGKMRPVRALLLSMSGVSLKGFYTVVAGCGDKRCVCEEHAKTYTKRQHMAYMGRNVDAKGPGRTAKITAISRATKAKLTIEQAREIRASDEPGPVLAEKYGVHRGVVSRIRRGIAWRDASNPFAALMG